MADQSITQALQGLLRIAVTLVADPSDVDTFNATISSLKHLVAEIRHHEQAGTLVLKVEDKDKEHRKRVLLELVNTERDYVDDLDTIQQVFMAPLRPLHLLQEQDRLILFQNIPSLFELNSKLLAELELRLDPKLIPLPSPAAQRRGSHTSINDNIDGDFDQTLAGTGCVGDVFERVSDFLKLYTSYCANQPKALERLAELTRTDDQFAQFLVHSSSMEAVRGLSANAFLIKPVQRICKYPLLLEQLLKHTPETHADHEPLKRALVKVNAVVAVVNEKKRTFESQQKILEISQQISDARDLISPTRLYVRDGPMRISIGNSVDTTECYLWLFNDLLLVTVKQAVRKLVTMLADLTGRSARGAKYSLKASFPLQSTRVIAMADRTDAFQIQASSTTSGPASLTTIIAANTAERDSWFNSVRDALRSTQKQHWDNERRKTIFSDKIDGV